eukprot:18055-Heterococcus_DN1.PRE.5
MMLATPDATASAGALALTENSLRARHITATIVPAMQRGRIDAPSRSCTALAPPPLLCIGY